MIRFIKLSVVFTRPCAKILVVISILTKVGLLSVFAQPLIVYENLTICPGIDYTIGEPNPQQGHYFSWSPEFYFLNPQLPQQTINFDSGSPLSFDIDIECSEFSADSEQIKVTYYTLTLNPNSGVTQTIFSDNICLGDTTFFPIDSLWPVNYYFQPINYVIYSQNPEGFFAFPNQTTIYTVSFIDSSTCFLTQLNHEIIVSERPDAFISIERNKYCTSDTLVYNFELVPDTGILFYMDIEIENSFRPSDYTEGNHTYIITASNMGCVSTDSVEISIIGPGTLNLEAVPNICSGAEPLLLDFASPPGGVYLLNTDTVSFIDPAVLNPGVDTLFYELNVDSLCTFTVSDIFTIIPAPPQPEISSNGSLIRCDGDSVRLEASFFTGYRWSTGDTANAIYVNQTDWYTLQVISNTGCLSKADSIYVAFNQAPQIVLESFVFPNGYSVSAFGATDGTIVAQIEGGTPPFVYEWAPVLGQGIELNNLSTGTYTLTVVDSAGCSVAEQIDLTGPPTLPESPVPFALPNGFTPNGDGFNDFYTIVGLLPDYQNNLLKVWDVRRQLVFETQNYLNEWDGRDLNGNRLPAGTYFLVFRSEKLQGGFSTGVVDLRYE